MPQGWMAPAAIVLMLAALGFTLFYEQRHPRRIVGTGTVRVVVGGSERLLETRDVSIDGVVFREVLMPRGTWIGCGGDCVRAVREAREGFWDDRPSGR